MERFDQLRKSTFPWMAMIVCVVLIFALFIFGMFSNRRDMNETALKETQLQFALSEKESYQIELKEMIDEVDSDSQIETRARSEYGYMKSGEIRFRVSNPDLLDYYTEEEAQIVSDELALKDW